MYPGCFCCIGGCQEALGLSAVQVEGNVKRGRSCADSSGDIIDGCPTGAVRASLGYMSSRRDCDALLNMLRDVFLDKTGNTLQTESASVDSATVVSVSDSVVAEGSSRASQPHEAIQLRSIYVYPIKSCAGDQPFPPSCSLSPCPAVFPA
jgi:molybdenum cofactor sulfurtransferase